MNSPMGTRISVPGNMRMSTYTAALVVKADRNTVPLKDPSG